MLLKKILTKTPIVQSLIFFPLELHIAALKKLFMLWVFTSLPIIVATVLGPVPDGDANILIKLTQKLREAISMSEAFVYTAAFLTPILYLIIEKLPESDSTQFSERINRSVNSLFKGYGLIAAVSLIILFLTAVAFSRIKTLTGTDSADYEQTFLYFIMKEYSLYIYIYSVFCWYLTLLDNFFTGNYASTNKEGENELAANFSQRLQSREKGNE